jgi:hypothetical protein
MNMRASTVKIHGMILGLAIAISPSASADQPALAIADETKKAAQELAAKFAGDAPAETQQTPMTTELTTGSINETEAPPMLAALSQSARAAGEHAFDYETFARQEEDAAKPSAAPPAKASKRKVSKRRKRDRNGADAYRQARVAAPPLQAAAAAKKADDEPGVLAKIFTPSEWSWSGGDSDAAKATPPPAPAPAFTDNEPTAADTTRSALQP